MYSVLSHFITQIIKDWILFIIVLIVVAIDLLIITIGTAVPSSRLNATLMVDTQHQTAVDVMHNYSK